MSAYILLAFIAVAMCGKLQMAQMGSDTPLFQALRCLPTVIYCYIAFIAVAVYVQSTSAEVCHSPIQVIRAMPDMQVIVICCPRMKMSHADNLSSFYQINCLNHVLKRACMCPPHTMCSYNRFLIQGVLHSKFLHSGMHSCSLIEAVVYTLFLMKWVS